MNQEQEPPETPLGTEAAAPPPAGTPATAGPLITEGPLAETGDIELRGRYVAGHDIVFAPPEFTDETTPPFLIVDREYLEEQLRKPKMMYVARSPTWADVVHGFDPELKFIERDQTSELYSMVREELLEPSKRGTDTELHSLFVLGAPGAGKTTLARRVAAMLVLEGEFVVADFGVNTERVSPEEMKAHIIALDKLARRGTPVLLLLDDPFFANSGWVELLRTLSRPNHRGISVLGASPDFLFDRFGKNVFGRRVVGRTFSLHKPSLREKESLQNLHDRGSDLSLESDDDLLVVSMEAATGESFQDIIKRIWMTLNGGVPVDSTIDHRRLPWPVVAYAVVCYFHRNYVLCPEPLLREVLLKSLMETPPSYLTQELGELVTREGWQIFSAQTTTVEQGDTMRLLGATHARVAREAWRYCPLGNLNIEKTVVDLSVQVPQASHQLAELILALQSSPTTSERRIANRFAVRWSNAVEKGAVETAALCTLVRQLGSSRPARLQFRGALRKCLNAQDDQSWLAAWQLYHLASFTLHPKERDFLLKVNLPYTLKIADLSKGPRDSISIATRLQEVRRTVVERLLRSLRGELDWRLDAEQVAWLINNQSAEKTVAILDHIYNWLEEDLTAGSETGCTSGSRVVAALVGFLETAAELDAAAKEQVIAAIFDWLLTSTDADFGVIYEIIKLAENRAASGDPSVTVVLRHVAELLAERSENSDSVWAELITLMGRSPAFAELAQEIVPQVFECLRARSENNEGAWTALISLVGRLPAFAELAQEVVPEAFERLRGRPENNEGAWAALIALVGRSPAFAELAQDVVPQAFEWLRDRPENIEAAWAALISLVGRSPAFAELAQEIVPQAFERLQARPENNEAAWAALISLLGRSPAFAELAQEIVPQAFERLQARPENNEAVWTALIALVGRSPAFAELAQEVVPLVFERLQARPENNEAVWAALIALVGRSPAFAELAQEVVPLAFERLQSRPENNELAWLVLLTQVAWSPGFAELGRQVVSQGFERLSVNPTENLAIWHGMIQALAAPIELDTRKRADILAKLRQWSELYFTAENPRYRGIGILLLAETPTAEAVSVAEQELRHIENGTRPDLMILLPLARLVDRLWEPRLSARLQTFIQRFLEENKDEDSLYYVPLIALREGFPVTDNGNRSGGDDLEAP